ncbi:Major facilitator superfamily transporter [Azotobacter vinelandii CA]|uniref:Major facilitator superfamily transporter n=2 Tax=Azotobacter vinelandii TaxID=354 RepID=C1DIV7_AZOVD|nr:MFS transporter [Azotobacter vinelandii]ACO80776.1 Major facilitator superfamily transporter [Azotobacter vinelandii DJ]AGK14280.1 Major facilitator superfamily transporter [Azotobacter vinelandii CA]AGK22149.1 Major facilitator superfamily transporter [Azotobacter vinelandii CA6]WKN21576.1 MFS transporter [Azotobacter vinelandii]SFX03698.1 MFS transporter, MHS family, metabolite:H+ symporter [Azotobacter vinelandii]
MTTTNPTIVDSLHATEAAARHDDGIQAKDLRRAAWACSVGSALEYYDFALYTLASALIFGPLFFPEQTPEMRLIASFGTYFLGFAVRPVGGILFGMLGDRLGRKFVLSATVLLMGVSSALIGALPTFQTAGYLAPVLLVVLRLLQGLGAGAEQAGAAVMMTEYAPPGRRGFYAALPFLGIQMGTLLAAAVYLLMVSDPERITESWLWRLPFLLSVIIIGVGLYMRLRLKESPTFVRMQEHKRTLDNPLKTVLTHSRRTLLIGVGLRLAENGGSSIYQALAVSFIVGVIGLEGPVGVITLICAAAVGACTVPIAGKLSDRFGRVAVYRAFAFLQLALAFPVWWVLSQGEVVASVIAISIALGIGTWGMFGTQAALMPELFGAGHRYMGVSVAREASAAVAGGIAPMVGAGIIAAVVALNPDDPQAATGAWFPIACYLALLTLTTIYTTFKTPETLNRDLDDPRDAAHASPAAF